MRDVAVRVLNVVAAVGVIHHPAADRQGRSRPVGQLDLLEPRPVYLPPLADLPVSNGALRVQPPRPRLVPGEPRRVGVVQRIVAAVRIEIDRAAEVSQRVATDEAADGGVVVAGADLVEPGQRVECAAGEQDRVVVEAAAGADGRPGRIVDRDVAIRVVGVSLDRLPDTADVADQRGDVEIGVVQVIEPGGGRAGRLGEVVAEDERVVAAGRPDVLVMDGSEAANASGVPSRVSITCWPL